jgi:hypothetical protein
MNTGGGLHEALDEATIARLVAEFHRDGFAVVRGVLSRDECAYLCRRTDELKDDPVIKEQLKHGYSFVLANPLLYDRTLAVLFEREPILSLVRAVLGPECRFCGQSVIYNQPGEAVSFWHVDDCNKLEMPLPDDVPRWPEGAQLPVHWLSVQIALTDILTLEDGPTEVVRGSHYSGRLPTSQETPFFEGRGAEPIFCHAGDIYLFNHQVWHRGRPNLSDHTRYLLQLQYARGDRLAVRMQGAPQDERLFKLLDGADKTLREVLLGPPKYV